MRAFVTGGTGFIGANLVAELNELGIAARVLHRPSSSLKALEGLFYEPVHGNILDEPGQLAEAMAGCDWVFHVAAVADYWRQSVDWLYQVNVEGTRRVVQAARLAGARRLVFTSSLAAMGLPEKGKFLDESNRYNQPPGQWPYAHSKLLAEAVVLEAVEAGLDAVVVNPSIVIGPRDLNRISGSLILEAANGRLRFTAPGGTNFIAAQDVAAGHVAAAELGRTGERYILGVHNLPYTEAVAAICALVGQSPPLFKVRRWMLPPAALAVSAARRLLGNRIPLDPTQVRMMAANLYADNGKARRELGLPETPFTTAFKDAYNWYRVKGYL